MEPPPACGGIFHHGHFAGALLAMPGFSFTFRHMLSARKTSWDPTTECIEVNSITFRAQIPLSCNSSSVKARQISEFGLAEGKKKSPAKVQFLSSVNSFIGKVGIVTFVPLTVLYLV